ncbi:hypothetical protein SK128_008435 [Halocaridina rubra]|uniref:Ionotropic glutamate receptor C-terminal domain-containing protein n=1 Tax=Halocaridina rubra TaxID=373956 RepID=A0AAN8WZQ9_HALRR
MDGVGREVNELVLNRGLELVAEDGRLWKLNQLLFTDDTILVADTENDLNHLVTKFINVWERKKLQVNIGKSRVMRCMRSVNAGRLNVGVNEELLEDVESFKYLGSHESKSGRIDVEINWVHSNKTITECGPLAVLGFRSEFFEVFASFFGQGLTMNLYTTFSSKVVVTVWLFFSLILVTVYKGNLIASLVTPRYPFRPDFFEELIGRVEVMTMPDYSSDVQDMLKNADNRSYFRKLSSLVRSGYDSKEGLQLALDTKSAHCEPNLYLKLIILKEFTGVSGESQLYISKDYLMPSYLAWPIPHDAPFKPELDALMNSVVESYLYNKWVEKQLELYRKEGKERGVELQQNQESTVMTSGDTSLAMKARALTLVHIQGPGLLLALGIWLSTLVFFLEILHCWTLKRPAKISRDC